MDSWAQVIRYRTRKSAPVCLTGASNDTMCCPFDAQLPRYSFGNRSSRLSVTDSIVLLLLSLSPDSPMGDRLESVSSLRDTHLLRTECLQSHE